VVFRQEKRLLERGGHEVVTYIRSNDEAVTSSALDQLRLVKTIISADQTRREMDVILKAERPSLVHIHNTFMMISPSIYETCVEANIPTVQTVHNYRLLCPAACLFRDGKVCEECIDHGLMRSVQHACYRGSHANTAAVAVMLKIHRLLGTWSSKVDAFIALTEFAKGKLVGSGFPSERIHVKPNFIEHDPGAKKGLGEYALFVGRLSSEKGIETLLEAWQIGNLQIPLWIAGDGPMRAKLEAKVMRDGLRNVQFLGRLSQVAITDVMKGARFVVIPSLWYEGFPMVLAESFACGVPVLGSKLGAMEEVIEDGEQGLHFTAGSAGDLAEKVTWAWSHAVDMATMGRACRHKYEKYYGPEANYAALMKIYEGVALFPI